MRPSRSSSNLSQVAFFTAIVVFLALCPPCSGSRKQMFKRRTQLEPLQGPAAFIAPRASQSSAHVFSLHRWLFSLRKLLLRSGGLVAKAANVGLLVTEEHCRAQGLEKCGNECVAHCCNQETALACPLNSYCAANEEYEFCCENGQTCEAPASCLALDDPYCDDNEGDTIVLPNGETRSCCYKGFETCTTILGGLSVCIPSGAVQVPPRGAKPVSLLGARSPLAASVTTSATGSEVPRASSAPKGTITKRQDNPSLGNVIGGLFGGILGLTNIGVAIIIIRRHYRKRREHEDAELANSAISTPETSSSSSASSYYLENVHDFETKMSGAQFEIKSLSTSDSSSGGGRATPSSTTRTSDGAKWKSNTPTPEILSVLNWQRDHMVSMPPPAKVAPTSRPMSPGDQEHSFMFWD